MSLSRTSWRLPEMFLRKSIVLINVTGGRVYVGSIKRRQSSMRISRHAESFLCLPLGNFPRKVNKTKLRGIAANCVLKQDAQDTPVQNAGIEAEMSIHSCVYMTSRRTC